ncbi:MAG: hypothetical protein LAP87_19350 [Acidobacteriia bacterium]|nr:hypothetical protein [Terriglobia bacterium]MBZ5727140.1 hypothetical protein [Terriglobia bacterium]
MRREADFFEDREMDLIYIAKRLKDALRLEGVLTEWGVDYAVETDTYSGGVIFRHQRVGAFFYVLPEALEQAREVMRQHGFKSLEFQPQ